MRLFKSITCAAALTMCLAPGVSADEWNKQTFLTFSGPVQIPGTTLAAGTYQFKLADLTGNRHIVQVFDRDGMKIFGTFMTIPVETKVVPEKPVIMFNERPAGQPQAVRIWYYPGDTIGDEFVYPKSQAMQIAKESHTSVLAMTDETSPSTVEKNTVNGTDRGLYKSARIGRVDENGNVTDTDEKPGNTATGGRAAPMNQSTATSAAGTAQAPDRPQGTTGKTAQADRTRPSTGQGSTSPTNEAQTNTAQAAPRTGRSEGQLPRTASRLPLLELLTGLAFAGTLRARHLRRRLSETR